MRKVTFDLASVAVIASAIAVPAFAGQILPAPVAGVGIGALALLGLGYRALRKRIDN